MQNFSTSDLCDAYGDALQVARSVFRDYGAVSAFHGRIVTLRVDEVFIPIRELLRTPGEDRVLVVDGGASMNTALLGGRMAELARKNDWSGIVINGCVRDVVGIAEVSIGVKALNTCPRRPGQSETGQRDIQVSFAGVVFNPGDYLYADEDGIVVSAASCEPRCV